MSPHILLHGADQHLGRLFVAEALAEWSNGSAAPDFVIWLSGSDAAAAHALAQQHGLDVRQLDLSAPPAQLAQRLAGIDVLVDAANPFDDSAVVLAQAAISAGCHWVDLNPEVRVFRKLQLLAGAAAAANVALVLSAGPGAAPSALMVSAALRLLNDGGHLAQRCVGALRIALQCVPDASRGSAASAWRALSRDVTVVRAVAPAGSGGSTGAFRMRPGHVPIGVLERTFDFAVGDGVAAPQRDAHIAAAADLVDTLAANTEVERLVKLAGTVESYVLATTAARIAYPLAAGVASLLVPLSPKHLARSLAAFTFGMLSEAPSVSPGPRHTIVLEIEDEERMPITDWRLSTPDFYLTGARCAVAVAAALPGGGFSGVLGVPQVLGIDLAAPPPLGGALRDCWLDRRVLV
jgi:short subunit dehydrogenase-like uncharacterized protein